MSESVSESESDSILFKSDTDSDTKNKILYTIFFEWLKSSKNDKLRENRKPYDCAQFMTTDVKKNSLQAWWMAIRIKTLCVPSAAVFSATLLAQNEKFPINGWLAFDVLAVALLITMATNLVNDGMDFFKGKDTVHRLGFKRVSQSGLLPPLLVYQAGIGLFFLAAIASIPLMFQGNIFCILIPLSIAAGYCYTGGSYPLSYHGLGELFVLVFFGWIITGGVYYLQAQEYNISSFILGTQMGLLATALIAINNFRDRAEDKLTGKKTLSVRFGISFSRLEISFCLLAPFLLNLFWLQYYHWTAFLLPTLTLPLALYILFNLWQEEPSARFNRYFGQAARLQILFGILLGFGFFFS